jgi:hypothetical protein
MPSEAMHVAEARPQLLELCAVLDFVGVEDWANACARGKWPVAERIDSHCVSLLNQRYTAAIGIEPTIQEYRKAVRERNTRLCVRLLRRIAAQDSGARHWEEDLRAFERSRQAEMVVECRAAHASADSGALESLLCEIDEKWHVAPDPQLAKEIRSVHCAVLDRKANDLGVSLLASASTAHSSGRVDELERTLRDYDKLVADGRFRPDESAEKTLVRARMWLAEEQARRAADSAYASDLASLTALAACNPPTAECEQAWLRLQRHGRHIPEDVTQTALAAIARHRKSMVLKRRMVLALSVAAIITVAAGVAAGVSRWRYLQEEAHWCRAAESTFEARDLPGFSDLAKHPPMYRPVLVGRHIGASPSVLAWTTRTDELAGLADDRTAGFLRTQARLMTIREGGFTEPGEHVIALFREARDLALTGEHVAFLDECERDWQASNDARIAPLLADLASTMPTITAFRTNTLSQVASTISSLRGTLTRAIQIKGASAETYKKVASASNDVAAIEVALAPRLSQYALISGAATPTGYMEALADYSESFPDDSLSRGAAEILQLGPKAYTAFLDIWKEQDLHRRALAERIATQWPAVKLAVGALVREDALLGLRFFSYQDMFDERPVVRFVKGTLKDSGSSVGSSQYRGKVYLPKAEDIVADFRDTTVPRAQALSVAPMYHCKLLKELLSGLDGVQPQDAVGFMLTALTRIVRAPTWDGEDASGVGTDLLSPILKLQLLTFFCEQTVRLTGRESAPQLELALEEMRAVDISEVDWLCVKNPRARSVSGTCSAVLAKHFPSNDWTLELSVRALAERAAVERGVVWSGCVDSTRPDVILWRGITPREAWVLRTASDGAVTLRMALVSQDGKALRRCTPLLPCEPLLSPKDDSLTAQALQRIGRDLSIADPSAVTAFLPINWPRID